MLFATVIAGAGETRAGRKGLYMADLIEQCRAAGQAPSGNAQERAPEKQQGVERDARGAAGGRNGNDSGQELSASQDQDRGHGRER
jgi:hypothetical protein